MLIFELIIQVYVIGFYFVLILNLASLIFISLTFTLWDVLIIHASVFLRLIATFFLPMKVL